MKRLITAGATDQTVYIFVPDSSSTTGAGLTGLAYNTASLVCYYVRDLAAATALTLATQTVTGAHSDGGFVEVSSANTPGLYRLDLSDAVCAAGVNNVVVMLKGAANMAPVVLEIQLGGGQIATLTGHTAQTGDAYARLGAPAGASVSADVAAVKTDTGTLTTRIVGTLDTGTHKPQTGDAYARLGAPAGASISADIATRLATSGYTAPPSAATIADAVWDEVLDGAHTVSGSGGSYMQNLDAVVSDIPNAATWSNSASYINQAVADAVWDEVLVGAHTNSDTSGYFTQRVDGYISDLSTDISNLPTAATIADAVWDENMDPHIAGGSSGEMLTNIHATGSEIKAKTDLIPAAPASTTNITTVGAVSGAVGSVTGNVGGNVTGSVGSIATGGIAAASFAAGAIDAAAIAADAIGASELAAGAASEIASAVRTELATELGRISGDAYVRLGAPAGASVSADIAAVKAVDDAIKAKTDNLPAAPASTTNITAATGITLTPTTGLGNQTANITGNLSGSVGSVAANGITSTSIATDAINAAAVKADAVTKIQNGLATPTNITAAAGIALSSGERTTLADAILDRTNGATANYTLRQALEVMLSVLAGKLSGAATATITIRDINDTKNVLVVSTDSSGNRTALTITP